MELARTVLTKFWSRYERICPTHTVFTKIRQSEGRLQPYQFLPLLVHGDEGTTYKKNGFLIIQFCGVIGAGSSKTKSDTEWHKELASCGIPINLVKNSFKTRFLTFACPKDWVVPVWLSFSYTGITVFAV